MSTEYAVVDESDMELFRTLFPTDTAFGLFMTRRKRMEDVIRKSNECMVVDTLNDTELDQIMADMPPNPNPQQCYGLVFVDKTVQSNYRESDPNSAERYRFHLRHYVVQPHEYPLSKYYNVLMTLVPEELGIHTPLNPFGDGYYALPQRYEDWMYNDVPTLKNRQFLHDMIYDEINMIQSFTDLRAVKDCIVTIINLIVNYQLIVYPNTVITQHSMLFRNYYDKLKYIQLKNIGVAINNILKNLDRSYISLKLKIIESV